MRDEAKQIPSGRTRGATLAEGDRYFVAEVDRGHVEVVLDVDGLVIIHSGPADSVRARVAIDAPQLDKAAIDAVLAQRKADGGRG